MIEVTRFRGFVQLDDRLIRIWHRFIIAVMVGALSDVMETEAYVRNNAVYGD